MVKLTYAQWGNSNPKDWVMLGTLCVITLLFVIAMVIAIAIESDGNENGDLDGMNPWVNGAQLEAGIDTLSSFSK